MEYTALSDVVIALVVILVIVGLFHWLYINPSKQIRLQTGLSIREKLEMKSDLRKTVLQFLGGFSFLAGIWVTWQRQ